MLDFMTEGFYRWRFYMHWCILIYNWFGFSIFYFMPDSFFLSLFRFSFSFCCCCCFCFCCCFFKITNVHGTALLVHLSFTYSLHVRSATVSGFGSFSCSPWYNCTGWLGIKHQLTYWLIQLFMLSACLLEIAAAGHHNVQVKITLLTGALLKLLQGTAVGIADRDGQQLQKASSKWFSACDG